MILPEYYPPTLHTSEYTIIFNHFFILKWQVNSGFLCKQSKFSNRGQSNANITQVVYIVLKFFIAILKSKNKVISNSIIYLNWYI